MTAGGYVMAEAARTRDVDADDLQRLYDAIGKERERQDRRDAEHRAARAEIYWRMEESDKAHSADIAKIKEQLARRAGMVTGVGFFAQAAKFVLGLLVGAGAAVTGMWLKFSGKG